MLKSTLLALVAQCAPNVAADTMLAIISTESAGNPWAIGVNKGAQITPPKSQSEAVKAAKQLAAKGASFDMGLGQINSNNMAWLGLSFEKVFDPCTNITAAAKVLTNNYKTAVYSGVKNPLGAALSMYNTGSPHKGFRNGYVSKVYKNHGSGVGKRLVNYEALVNQSAPVVPAITAGRAESIQNTQIKNEESEPPRWDVFAHYQWTLSQKEERNDVTIYSQN